MIRIIQNYNINDIVSSMKDFLNKSSYSPEVREMAVEITAGSQNPIYDIHKWVKTNLHYAQDPVRDGQDIEMFTSPVGLVKDYREGKSIAEDCDSHAMLVTALCQSIGIPARVVLTSYDNGNYTHAYSQVWSEELNKWLDVDTTTDYPIGWVIPYSSIMII